MPSLPKASLSRCAESGEEIPSRQRSVSVYYKAIVIITHARNIRYASEAQAMNHREVYCPAITLFAGRLLVENPLVFSLLIPPVRHRKYSSMKADAPPRLLTG
jgi:hypothetical protein